MRLVIEIPFMEISIPVVVVPVVKARTIAFMDAL
jgi:hypothetical protein